MLQADTRVNGRANVMSDVWKQWEGHVVDGRFPLRQYLGESEGGPVFLTEHVGQRAAIKLTTADPQTADAQLARWTQASRLSHPHLLRILGTGRCEVGGSRMVYAVMEYADEDLSQIVPLRALTETEARDMLRPILEALAYVHSKGLAHGHLKPSNIMAVGEDLKISSDGICAMREVPSGRARATLYDAPEAGTRGASAGADVWSLGVTLVEVLTQKLPNWEWKGQEEPELPRMPAPFGDIAKQCLRRDPQRRCTLAEIATRLDPDAPPLSSLPPVAAKPAPALPAQPVAASRVKAAVPAQQRAGTITASRNVAPSKTSSRFVLQAAVVLVLVALVALGVLKFANRGSAAGPVDNSSAPSTETPAKALSEPEAAVSSPRTEAATKSHEPVATAPVAEPTPPSPPPAPKPVATNTRAAIGGSVARQVMPDVPRSASATIHGKVRVGVRVHVAASGKVTGAELESAGPSKYFASLAQKAARDWEFVPPTADGQPSPSEWILRFEFTQDDTKAAATRTRQ